MDKTVIALALSGLLASSVMAETFEHGRYKTVVLEDRGGLNIRKYIPTIQNSESWRQERFAERGTKKLVNGMYPVKTPSMQVGPVGPDEGKDIPAMAMSMRAMFIIGDDPVSWHWLSNNREFLKDKKAVGLVVNVDSAQRMNALTQIAGEGLVLQPTPGEDLAKHLGIRHYPFYLDKDGVMR